MRPAAAFPLALAVSIALSMVSAIEARADCASPQPGFQPASGATIPARARVLLFVPSYEATGSLHVTGAAFTHRVLAKAPDVVAIEVQLRDAIDTVELEWRHGGSSSKARYTVGKVSKKRARVEKVEHTSSAWTCSHTNVIALAMSGTAIGYRFAWSDGIADVVPANSTAMWPHHDAKPALFTRVELGHLNCIGHNADPQRLGGLRELTLYALFVDGSEQLVGTASAKLSPTGGVILPDFSDPVPPAPPTPGPQIATVEPPPVAPLAVAPQRVVTREIIYVHAQDDRPRWILAIAVFAGALSLIACLIAMRRR